MVFFWFLVSAKLNALTHMLTSGQLDPLALVTMPLHVIMGET